MVQLCMLSIFGWFSPFLKGISGQFLDWFRRMGPIKELEKRVLGHIILSTTCKQMFEEKVIHTLLLS